MKGGNIYVRYMDGAIVTDPFLAIEIEEDNLSVFTYIMPATAGIFTCPQQD